MATQPNPNNPYSYFYWNDWENEPSLSLCSLSAQGFWMRLLCIAAKCEPFGYLSVNGRALSLGDLSKMTGHPAAELEMLLKELEANGVFSRDTKQRIYSRRMVRDAKYVAEARKNGKKGGNPSLRKDRGKSHTLNPPLKAPLNPNTFNNTNNTPLPPPEGEGDLGSRKDGTNPRAIGTNPRATGDNPRSNPELPKGPPWRQRVMRFFDTGFWLPDWGEKPLTPQCAAPDDLVQELYKNHKTLKGTP